MVKIKASYQRPEELHGLLQSLQPIVEYYKIAEQKGQHKRAYIYLRAGFETGITIDTVPHELV